MQKLTYIFALSCLLSLATSTPAGIALGVDQGVITDLEYVFMPYLIDIVNTMAFPTIEKDGFKITDLYVHLDEVAAEDLQIEMHADHNSIYVKANNVGGTIKGHMKYVFLFVPVQADFEAVIKEGGASLEMEMPLWAQVDGEVLLPAFFIQDLIFNLDHDKVDLKIYGSLVADVLNLFIQIFDDLVLNIITSQVEDKVPDLLSAKINAAILETHGLIELPNGIGFQFAYVSTPYVLDTQADLFLNGTFYYVPLGIAMPLSQVLPDITLNQTSTNMIQMELSKYSADTLLLTLDEAGLFDIVLDGTNLAPTMDFALDTTHLDQFFPGLVDLYGADVPMSIEIKSSAIPESVFHEDQMGAVFSFSTAFNVEGQGAAFILNFQEVEVVLTIKMENFILYPSIDRIKIGDIVVTEAAISGLSPKKLKLMFNTIISVAVPFINLALAGGIAFPSDLFSGKIVIEYATFKAWESWVQIELVPHFNF